MRNIENMLKPVKPRGDTSVTFLLTGLYISERMGVGD